MNVANYPVQWYVDKIAEGETFSLGHYGDGEWQCIFNALGSKYSENCEGTKYTEGLSQTMLESLDFKELGYYFATSGMLQTDEDFLWYGRKIDEITSIEFVEKGVWNEAMWKGELYPLITELRKHNVCIVSNKMLRGLTFLNYDKFIEIGYPNCYEDMDRAVKEVLGYGKEGVYLFACGIPAALYTQALHNKIPHSWFLDLGSIWDGFAGIGGQRATRREFYLHPETWVEWVDQNLKEIEWPREIPKVHWHGMGSLDINPNL